MGIRLFISYYVQACEIFDKKSLNFRNTLRAQASVCLYVREDDSQITTSGSRERYHHDNNTYTFWQQHGFSHFFLPSLTTMSPTTFTF